MVTRLVKCLNIQGRAKLGPFKLCQGIRNLYRNSYYLIVTIINGYNI